MNNSFTKWPVKNRNSLSAYQLFAVKETEAMEISGIEGTEINMDAQKLEERIIQQV